MKISMEIFCYDAEGRGALARLQDVELEFLATDPVDIEAMKDFTPKDVGSWQIYWPNGNTLGWLPFGFDKDDG